MKKSSPSSEVVFIVLLSFIMLSACATLPNAKPGLYVNENLRFTVNYPENWQPQPLQGPVEVLRVANPNQWKLPVLTVSVLDLTKDAKLEDAAKGWIEAVKRDIPGTKRFKIFSETMVTLEDGTQAAAYTLKWNWTDGVTKLQTAAVTAYKGEKSVTVTATTVLG